MDRKDGTKMRKGLAVIPIMTFVLLSFAGCTDSARVDLEKAEANGTVEAYEEFLKKHPQSKYTGQARSKYTELARKRTETNEYQEAQKGENLGALKRFVIRHPDSEYLRDALARIKAIRSERDWPPPGSDVHDDIKKTLAMEYGGGPIRMSNVSTTIEAPTLVLEPKQGPFRAMRLHAARFEVQHDADGQVAIGALTYEIGSVVLAREGSFIGVYDGVSWY